MLDDNSFGIDSSSSELLNGARIDLGKAADLFKDKSMSGVEELWLGHRRRLALELGILHDCPRINFQVIDVLLMFMSHH